ncbi:MAG: hypothetical protein H7A00_01980 [Hahellaceae bacterium]|nr:hypothetical protein [Hahellaceae bacterium]
MKRKLAVAISLISALGASTVNALGLGEATVKSTLNQPLNAEIELLNIKDLGADEILPGLATREDFIRSGIERVYFLSDLRFNVVNDSKGRPVIQLSTNKPVREPYLNFLVEVIWPSGRLLREYALLIDPPVFGEEKAMPVNQAKTGSTTTTNASPASSGVAVSPSVSSTGGATKVTNTRSTASEEGTYGPTTNADTLWAIALRVRPESSVSPQQTMLAIQDLNPDAFYDSNINKLKAGQVLRTPSLEQIKQRSNREAISAVVAQNRAFETGQLAPQTVDATALSSNKAPLARTTTGDELKLVVPRTQQEAAKAKAHAGEIGGAGDEAVRTELIATQERLDKSLLEKDELSSKVKDLEEQMQTLKRLLSLKDDQLAAMQAQMGQLSEQEIKPVDAPAQQSVSAVTSPETATDTGGVDQEGQAVTPKDAGTPADMGNVKPASVSGESEGTQSPTTAQSTVQSKPIAPPPPVAPKPPVAPETKSLPDQIMSALSNNPLYQGLAAGAGLLLVLLLWMISRNNARKEQEFYESIGQATEQDEVATASVVPEQEEDSEVANNYDDESSDPLTEANAYIMYGRLDQAASMLESAVSAEPGRTDIRLKLLEVYSQQGNSAAFDVQYRELEAMGDDYAIDQANRLRGDLGDEEEVISLDDLESQLLSDSSSKKSESALGRDSVVSSLSEAESDDISSLEFDTDLALDDIEDVSSPAVKEDVLGSDHDDLDIDFDVSELDEVVEAGASQSELADLQFNLDESLLDEEASAVVADKGDSESLDLDLGDISFAGDEAESGKDEEDNELSLGGDALEEVATEDSDFEGMDLAAELASLTDEDALLDETAEASSDELLMADADLQGQTPEEMLASIDEDLGLESFMSEGDESTDLELDESLTLDSSSEQGMDEALLESDMEFEGGLSDEEKLSLADIEGDLSLLEQELDADTGSVELVADDVDAVSLVDETDELSLADETDEISLADEVDEVSLAEKAVASSDDFEAELEGDEDFDFLSGTDEAATKLDLARAYIDMGDVDGARDILEEVSLEGSETQKQEALTLLKSIV